MEVYYKPDHKFEIFLTTVAADCHLFPCHLQDRCETNKQEAPCLEGVWLISCRGVVQDVRLLFERGADDGDSAVLVLSKRIFKTPSILR